MRNNHYVIDAHGHIFPNKLAERAAVNIGEFYKIPVAAPATVENLIALMDEQGIDLSVVSSSAMAPGHVAKINDFIIQSANMHSNRIVPVGTLHPHNTTDELESHIRFLLENKFHAVKIHPDMLAISVNDPSMEKIYDACSEAKLPLLLHTGDSRYTFSNPPMIEKVLKEHPELTLIGGHFAGLYHYIEAADTIAKYPNLYCDCSSSFVRLSREEALHCFDRFGFDRVMFGTDFPVCIPNLDLDYIFSLGFSDEILDSLLVKNAVAIYGITDDTLRKAGIVL